ncbi:N-6 DNA methylase [Acidithiobacillus concretivorus]
MADLVQPHLGHKIADPACGSGGFLLGAYQVHRHTTGHQGWSQRPHT